MFSLLHGMIFPHLGQFTVFPDKVAVSKDLRSPKAIGDLNVSLQFWQTTSVSAMINTSMFISLF